MNIEEYFDKISVDVEKQFELANRAKAIGVDPVNKVEVPIATTLAEKAIGLISTIYPQLNDKKIVNRIIELEKEYGQLDTAVPFKIAEEIAKEKFCKFKDLLEAMDAGIRVGFSYITLGVVSSPIEGFTQLKIGKTRKGEDYLIALFSGPIRSAGTTASCVVLMLIDYLREVFGFAKYDPDENEVKRYVTENYDYHERVNNLQYLPTEEEITFLAQNIPIQVAGEPTEDKEVSNYKDLERVETNFIRGGMCLIFSEGLAQKAQKGLRLWRSVQQKGFTATGWEFLDKFIEIKNKREKGKTDSSPTYIKDLVAGRPVFSHPSRSGGFRFRYGRSRNNGFSAVSVHPATMTVSGGFISNGTQLKVEKPTKGCTVSACDEIDGPIVRLKDGSVKRLKNPEDGKTLYSKIDEIIYLGDILFTFGDVLNRNYNLLKSPYVEEWWDLELKKKCKEKNIDYDDLKIDKYHVDFEQALDLSRKLEIPLHPEFIYFWKEITKEDLSFLIEWISKGEIKEGKLILPYSRDEKELYGKAKRALELIGCEHLFSTESYVLNQIDTNAVLLNLGMDSKNFKEKSKELIKKLNEFEGSNLEFINEMSEIKIKDKSGTFIGARMGRPEKAKLRKLTGSPHAIFPVGEEGGRLRSFQSAVEGPGYVKAEFPNFYCEKCNLRSIYPKCNICGDRCIKKFYCLGCDRDYKTPCDKEGHRSLEYKMERVPIVELFDNAKKIAKVSVDEIPIVKGVRGTSSKDHSCEHLAKGMLRAKYNLNVNKDGTIRYDMTEMVVTHFRPREIGASVEKLKSLGYENDIYGNPLENEEQMLEMFPHDILLPVCPDTMDEKADEVFLKISKFIDDELENIYGVERMFNAKTRDDLLGQLVVCIAPHICTATVGRLIGFSKTQALLASPYMHAAMRRDCFDYDTYLPINEKGNWKIEKMGDIYENLNEKGKVIDNFGTIEKRVNDFEALGPEDNDKISRLKVNNFTKHTKKKLLKIKTALGKDISVTENHKFLIGGKLKLASELKIGDEIPCPIKLDIEERDIKEIRISDILNNKKDLVIRGIKQIIKNLNADELNDILSRCKISRKSFTNYFLRDSFPLEFVLSMDSKLKEKALNFGKVSRKRDRISVPNKIKISDELLEVIGLYIAEGYSRKVVGVKGLNQVYIASNDDKLREFVKKVVFEHFGLKPSENKIDRVTFSSGVLYSFFIEFLKAGSNAREKRIPSIFLNLPKKRIACLLRGYFEGDGSAEKNRANVSFDSVSEGLLNDVEFCLSRFGIFVKRYEYEKEPGEIVKKFYISKKREIPKFKIVKGKILSDFISNFYQIGFLSERKNKILGNYRKMNPYGSRVRKDNNFVYNPIISIEDLGEKESYCLNVDHPRHLVYANGLISKQCDGDEAAAMFLMDLLLNFSKSFLPAHRGGTQDAPLVLNTRIRAGDVDDQILDFELGEYPLELYEFSEQGKHSSDIKNLDTVKKRLKDGKDPFTSMLFTHNTYDINGGVTNTAYKLIPTMDEKVDKQMELCKKIRAVDVSDVARLTIERHFVRDTRGNLRKFSMQGFRCVSCNDKYRRVPLAGKCLKCGGKLLFTISEGSILKYMQKSLDLAREYDVGKYILESLELTEMYIHSIFGKEKEKQEALGKWF